MEVNIYIGLDLEGEVHSIWDLWVSGLQECKSNEFFRTAGGSGGRAGGSFRAGPKNYNFFSDGRLALPDSDTPQSS